MNILTSNLPLDNSFFSNSSSKRDTNSLGKNNSNFSSFKTNLKNNFSSMNYSEIISNSLSSNYTPLYSATINKTKKFINTEPNLENEIKYNNIIETSKNLKKRIEKLINHSKEKDLIIEKNKDIKKSIYYRPQSSSQRIQNYKIGFSLNDPFKKQTLNNNSNLINNTNILSFSLNNNTNSNNSFSKDLSSINKKFSNINYDKRFNNNHITEKNNFNKTKINYYNQKYLKKTTPDKIMNKLNLNLNIDYLTKANRQFLEKLHKIPSNNFIKKKIVFENENFNESSDLSNLAENLVEAFDLESKSKEKKNKIKKIIKNEKLMNFQNLQNKKELNIKTLNNFEEENKKEKKRNNNNVSFKKNTLDNFNKFLIEYDKKRKKESIEEEIKNNKYFHLLKKDYEYSSVNENKNDDFNYENKIMNNIPINNFYNPNKINGKKKYNKYDNETNLIINQIINNYQKIENKKVKKHINFNLNSNININYNIDDEPYKIKITNSITKLPIKFIEKDMNKYNEILKNVNQMKSIIKSYDKDKILINKNYISAEYKSEEQIIPNLNELLNNNNIKEDYEQYEYYPDYNEINSLDSIEI
jgi:hypothetical protein